MITPDRSNTEWVEALSSRGGTQASALEDLREILTKGLSRALPGHAYIDDFVQESLVLVLRHLDSYQGRSKFTTWAFKIAIRTAFSELRRKRWKDVSLKGEMKSKESSPEEVAEKSAEMEWFNRAMAEELTEKQRTALQAVVMGGIPLEVVAERMHTNRNALYKLLHDARNRLKQRWLRDGFSMKNERYV